MTNHTGSRFDDFLEEQDLLTEMTAVAIDRVRAWHLANAESERDPNLPLDAPPSPVHP